jgi:hypothetical protein
VDVLRQAEELGAIVFAIRSELNQAKAGMVAAGKVSGNALWSVSADLADDAIAKLSSLVTALDELAAWEVNR